jgi:hypothetical protein
MTLLLSGADVKQALSMEATIDLIEQGFVEFGRGAVDMPQRPVIAVPPRDLTSYSAHVSVGTKTICSLGSISHKAGCRSCGLKPQRTREKRYPEEVKGIQYLVVNDIGMPVHCLRPSTIPQKTWNPLGFDPSGSRVRFRKIPLTSVCPFAKGISRTTFSLSLGSVLDGFSARQTRPGGWAEPRCPSAREGGESWPGRVESLHRPVSKSNSLLTLLPEDLMDPLPSDPEPVGYPLKSPSSFPQAGDRRVLSSMDLRIRMGMFEEEPTPVVPAIRGLMTHHRASKRFRVLGLVGKSYSSTCQTGRSWLCL